MKTKEGNRSAIIKDAGLYAGAKYASSFLDVGNGILLRNFINPVGMGVWALLRVILNYSSYITLGTGPALVREIPVYRGRGEEEKADKVKNNVFGFSMLMSAVLAIGMIAYAIIFRNTMKVEMMWGLIAVAIIFILQRAFNLYVVLLRAYKIFRMASLSTILSSVVTLLLTVTLVWKYGFYGLLLATIIGYIVIITIIQKNVRFKFRFELDPALLKNLSVFGLSLVILQVAATLLNTVDKIVIAKCLGFEALGYYSIAIMAQTYLTITPNVMDMILTPHMFEKITDATDPVKIKTYVLEPAITMACLMPCLIMFAWIFGPSLVALLMPKYVPGIPAFKILMFSSFFWGLTRPLMGFMVLIKKHLQLLPILLFSALVAVSLCLFFIFGLKKNIEYVAVAIVISYVLYGFGMLMTAARHLPPIRGFKLIIVKIFGPFFYMLLTAVVLQTFFASRDISTAYFLEVFAVYLVFILPLMILVEKETRLLSHVKEIVISKFMRPKEKNDSKL